MTTKTKTPMTAEELERKEYRAIAEIGWDAPKLKALLPSLKCQRNIQEVKKMLKRCKIVEKMDKQVAKTKKVPAKVIATKTIVTQCGLIKTIDSGSIVDYKVGKFSYLCDGNEIIVTKESGTSFVNIAYYIYKSDEDALEAGWRMAKKQETVEKEILKQQKAQATATVAKKQRAAKKVVVTV